MCVHQAWHPILPTIFETISFRADIWFCVFVLVSEKVTHTFFDISCNFTSIQGTLPTLHGECICTVVRMTDSGANDRMEYWSLLVITYNGLVGIVMCWWGKLCPILKYIKFVSRTHMTSLGCRISFIIDANLFRADWWQHFLPFTELELGFIKGLKLPAN